MHNYLRINFFLSFRTFLTKTSVYNMIKQAFVNDLFSAVVLHGLLVVAVSGLDCRERGLPSCSRRFFPQINFGYLI